jgi:ribosome-binding factor A
MDPYRSQRVSEAIREELSEIIGYELADPRLDLVDVTEVVVTSDKRHARVLLHLGGDGKTQADALVALEGARHFLRRQLASRLRLFRTPELLFEADIETCHVGRLGQLLKRVRKGRPKDGVPAEKSSLE